MIDQIEKLNLKKGDVLVYKTMDFRKLLSWDTLRKLPNPPCMVIYLRPKDSLNILTLRQLSRLIWFYLLSKVGLMRGQLAKKLIRMCWRWRK